MLMKRFSLFILLGCALVLAACGSSGDKESSENTNSGVFPVASCNKYLDLMQCTIKDIPAEEREKVDGMIDAVIEDWQMLDRETLQATCDDTWERLLPMKESYEALGCSMD
jgi:hypothetical protein